MYKILIVGNPSGISARTFAEMVVALNKLPFVSIESALKDDVPMPIVRNSYGKVGVQQPGRPEDIFLEMLDEVDCAYMRPLPWDDSPQPYQMLPEHWEAFVAIGSICYGVYPCFTEEQNKQRCAYKDYDGQIAYGPICSHMMSEMRNRYGFTHNGPLYGTYKQSNSRHEVHVAHALAEGKMVPEEVLAWYKSNHKVVDSIGEWFKVLINCPAYRGKMSAEKLMCLANLCKWDNIELTNENAQFYIELMSELPEDCGITAVDDFLYAKGILKLRSDNVTYQEVDLSKAYSPFAVVMQKMMGESRKEDIIARAYEQRNKYGHSLRRLHEELAIAKKVPMTETLDFPNKIAEAVDKKNIDILLAYLDTSNDLNVVAKKSIKQVFGVRLIGLKAEERKNAIFRFCGYSPEERAKYERSVMEKKQQHKEKVAA